ELGQQVVSARGCHQCGSGVEVDTGWPDAAGVTRLPMVSSSTGAIAARQIRISGSEGEAWLEPSFEPSMREVCRPADLATATGAAESHSYWPPLCTYASASPAMTAAALAPAEPMGTRTAPSRSARSWTNCGGRDRLTSSLIGPAGGSGTLTGSGAVTPPARARGGAGAGGG